LGLLLFPYVERRSLWLIRTAVVITDFVYQPPWMAERYLDVSGAFRLGLSSALTAATAFANQTARLAIGLFGEALTHLTDGSPWDHPGTWTDDGREAVT
jgi:hypothetical protein